MKRIISTAVLALAAISAAAQPMTYDRYYNLVAEKNVLYIAEKYNIDKATASVEAAKVFNDPELSVSYGNNQDWGLQMGQSVEMEMSINPDLAGVRRARIAVAQSERDLTEASVSAYLANLRLEAAEVWAEAWRLRENYAVLEASVDGMEQIARSDSLRFIVGDIGRSDALQSRLEAQTMKGELLKMQAEYLNALDAVSLFCGGEPVSSLEGDLPGVGLLPAESEIIGLAESNRADLKAAELSRTLSENNLKLVRASRAFELGINLGYSYNTEVRNEIAPAPRFNGLTVGVSIPLKFSRLNKGEVHAAQSEIRQSESFLEAARQKVRSEVIQAYNSLMAANAVKEQYNKSILEDAHSILESRKAGYMKGESSLMELLSAQQTYLDIMQAYTEACCDSFVCRAQLEQASGCTF
ncbi:MAG: TolC family protein [Bacteroidales bacterium]|nr:TolC family protein [Candidatus Cryptobacteroides onthequi]